MKDRITDEQSAFLVGKRRDLFIVALFIAAAFAVWHFFGVDQDKVSQTHLPSDSSTLSSEHQQNADSRQNRRQGVEAPSAHKESSPASHNGINPPPLNQAEQSTALLQQNKSQSSVQQDRLDTRLSGEKSPKGSFSHTFAEIIFLRGDAVKYSLPGKPVPVEKGSQLYAGERIETGKSSSLTLRFSDQSTAIVSEQSSVLFENLQRSEDSKTSVIALELSKGQLESRVNKQKGFDAKYEVRTPAMQLAVRGTVFETQVIPDSKTTLAMVLEGQVEVAQGSSEMILNQGFGVVAERTQTALQADAILSAPRINSLITVQKQFPLILGWQVLPGAKQYQVQLFSGKQGDQLVLEKWYRGNIASLNGLPNGRYLLRVRGVDKSGLGGFYGEARFILDVPPVAMMTLNSSRAQ